jgi:hypothetical protein
MRLRSLSNLTATWILTMIPVPTLAAKCAAHPTNLAEMRDCYRPLLIFAASKDDPKLDKQLNELRNHAPDLRERNIVVVVMIGNGEYPSSEQIGNTPIERVESVEAQRIRSKFQIGNSSFVALLVGKDGGEKSRHEDVFSVAKLNSTIDAMPMRQAEMR